MTYRTREEEAEPDEPQRSWLKMIAVLVGLVIVGAGSAVAWRSYRANVTAFSPLASTSPIPAPPPVTAENLSALKSDLQTLQQQSGTQLQLLSAQQVAIKTLSDQVAVLSGKLELLQRPVAPPVPASKPVSTAAKPAAPPPQKKPAPNPPRALPLPTGPTVQ